MTEELIQFSNPLWKCKICGEEMEENAYNLIMHLVDHVAELMIKVDKVLESIG